MFILLSACVTNVYPTEVNYYSVPDAESSDTGTDPVELVDGIIEDSGIDPSALPIDVFGVDGNRYAFTVSDEELAAMNDAWGSWWSSGYYYYSVGSDATWADDMTATVPDGTTADFGKVQLAVVGQSTGMEWSDNSIPTLSVDTDEFTDGLTVGGVEHLRFNNGMVSSIYREAIALAVFDGLGFPAPRTSFAWLASNVWGDGVTIPYTVVEMYRNDWCVEHAEELGGGCANVWEGIGDFSTDWGWGFAIADQCELTSCDNTRINELSALIDETPMDMGFAEATSEYIDWKSVERHMCADWILWVGDDPYHNMNNVVWVEGLDGKFRPMPYSTDISGGQSWYQDIGLYGYNQVAQGCEYDPECWSATIKTCEGMIDDFQSLDPVSIVNSVNERLTAQGMLRDGDEETYNELVSWYAERSTEGVLEDELENYREPWYATSCGSDTGFMPAGGGLDTGSPCTIAY